MNATLNTDTKTEKKKSILAGIRQAPSFYDSANNAHSSKRGAASAEYVIKLRSLFHKALGTGVTNLTPTQAAAILASNSAEFRDVMRRFDDVLQRMKNS